MEGQTYQPIHLLLCIPRDHKSLLILRVRQDAAIGWFLQRNRPGRGAIELREPIRKTSETAASARAANGFRIGSRSVDWAAAREYSLRGGNPIDKDALPRARDSHA